MTKKTEPKGILLAAFGKNEYAFMAAHMAASIKIHCDLPISILVDDSYKYVPSGYRKLFDQVITIKPEHYIRQGHIDPGFLKVNIPLYLPYKQTLYLDVDGMCIRDLTPIFETDKEFCTEVKGKGSKGDTINYNWWASTSNEWEHFELPEDAVFRTVQSSSMLFKKGTFVKKLHKTMLKYYDYPLSKLSNQWGGTVPDELIISGACANLDYDPSFEKKIVFFGHKLSSLSQKEISEQYFVLAMYGNKGMVRGSYLDWYDRFMRKELRKIGLEIIHPINILLRGKHVTVNRIQAR